MTDAAQLMIVIDHLSGSRRGQRQEFGGERRVRFGRHPDCEVSFDAHRDIDASSRHAELRSTERGWVLVDLGSSNGTFVDGPRVTEVAVVSGVVTTIEFGSGGPGLRLFIGGAAAIAGLPAPALTEVRRLPPWLPWVGAGTLLVATVMWIVLR
jgi:FHA domain